MSPERLPVEYILAENLRRLRNKSMLSEENMAKHAGLTLRGYREIEEERYVPTVNVLVRLARALGCKLDDLIPIDEIE